jgi:hypothetical protein
MTAENANELNGNKDEAEKPAAPTDTLIHDVARTVGATLGTIAVGTAKLLGSTRTKGLAGKTRAGRESSSDIEDSRSGKKEILQ